MESETARINKLIEAKHWTLWKFQVKIMLESIEAWDIVCGKTQKPSNESDTDHAKKLADYIKKDVHAKRIIVTTIGEKTLLHIVTCNSASEMWTKLQTVFEQKSQSGINFLQTKFFTHSMSDDSDLAGFISEIEEIVQQLKDLDTVIPESMVVTKITMALPPAYNHFHSAWDSVAEKEQTLDNLRSRLMIEERRMKGQSEDQSNESSALFMKNKKWQNKKGQNKNKDKKPGKCFVCGNGSHWKKDCPVKKNLEQSSAFIGDSCMLAVDYNGSWFSD